MAKGDPPPHEVRPCADPNDAGVTWRQEKLKDLVWRAKCLGIRESPEVSLLEQKMRESTQVLDQMAVEQACPTYERPWWKDGEYDEVRAETANDLGMELFKKKQYEKAFDQYTDAARLEPRRAGYHANRSACGLKLGRWKVAAEDAEVALKIDANHFQASLRAGKARMKLRQPEIAQVHFTNALRLDPKSELAVRGAAEASCAKTTASLDLERQRQEAREGQRNPLPDWDRWPTLELAAEQTLACEEILRANPNSVLAVVAAAEARVLCGAPKRALDLLAKLRKTDTDGKERRNENTHRNTLTLDADFHYVLASALWRVGDVTGAVENLTAFSQAAGKDNAGRRNSGVPQIPCPPKITSLGAYLTKVADLTTRGIDAHEEGNPDVAARAFDEALRLPPTRAFFFQDLSLKKNKKQAYPNRARGDLLWRRAEAILDAVEQGVEVDFHREPFHGQETAIHDSDDSDDDDDGAGAESENKPFSVAARDLRESILISPHDVDARRVRIRYRRTVGDILGAFDDARAALDANPGEPQMRKLAGDLAKEAMGDTSSQLGGVPGRNGNSGSDKSVPSPSPAAYRALGLAKSADPRAIRRGYRNAAKTWHPDKWQNASDVEKEKARTRFQKVQRAYELLGDRKTKRAYDADPAQFEV